MVNLEPISEMGMILFYLADSEILSLSGTIKQYPQDIIEQQLNLDLQLLVLVMGPDDVIVFPPTYYYENPIFRRVLLNNLEFSENGLLALLIRERDLYAFRDKKRETYKRVRKVPKYRDGYYVRHHHGLDRLVLHRLEKTFRSGSESLRMWERKMRFKANQNPYAKELNDAITKVLETESKSFLWESVLIEHVAHMPPYLQKPFVEDLSVRDSMSSSYLESHQRAGISLPVHSVLLHEAFHVPTGDQTYNSISIFSVFDIIGVIDKLRRMPSRKRAKSILLARSRCPEALADIRERLSCGKPSNEIVQHLLDSNRASDILRAFSYLAPQQGRRRFMAGIHFFISHSSEDELAAAALVRLLEASFEVDSLKIRCTSVDGYKVRISDKTSERLKNEISEASAVIGLLSPSSLQSSWVLFELGAAWGLGKATFSLLCLGASPEDLPGPLKEQHACNAMSANELHQLIDDIASLTSLRRKENSALISRAVQEVVKETTATSIE